MNNSLLRALTIGCAMYAVTFVANSADEAKAPSNPPCRTPPYRQFDFWIGDWDVRNPTGKLVGHNRVAAIHGGCALLEEWSGDGGFTGSSLNTYDIERARWHQTWVDNSGGLLQMDGGWADGRMVLAGDSVERGKPGNTTVNRITWQPLTDGRVRQLWETSTDRGATWKTAFDGFYEKRP